MPKKVLDSARSGLIAERLKETFGDDSTADICRKIGNVTASTVNFWKHGTNRPDYDTLIRICDMYGVSTDWILGRPGATKIPEKGIAAACDYTGLPEAAIQAMKTTRFKEELRDILLDEHLEDFLMAVSKIPCGIEITDRIAEEILELRNGTKEKSRSILKTAELYDDLKRARDNLDLSRFRLSEETLQTVERIYHVKEKVDRADQVLRQVDVELNQESSSLPAY